LLRRWTRRSGLGIDPAKLSDPAIRVETDGDLGHFAAWELYRNFGDRFR